MIEASSDLIHLIHFWGGYGVALLALLWAIETKKPVKGAIAIIVGFLIANVPDQFRAPYIDVIAIRAETGAQVAVRRADVRGGRYVMLDDSLISLDLAAGENILINDSNRLVTVTEFQYTRTGFYTRPQYRMALRPGEVGILRDGQSIAFIDDGFSRVPDNIETSEFAAARLQLKYTTIPYDPDFHGWSDEEVAALENGGD